MSTIRRQSIISTGIVYFGFALGALNTYLFTSAHVGGFTTTEYGLFSLFMSLASIMFPLASLGMQSYIYKFYPYYNDNLKPKDNDMMTWALLTSLVGFVFVIAGGIIFKNFVISQFGRNSPEFIKYYYWVFPFGFGFTFYSLLEALAWQLKKSVFTSFLKEVLFRVFTLALIVLSYIGILKDFDTFIKIYSFSYVLLTLCLLAYLVIKGQLHLQAKRSRVTKKFSKKILALISMVWSGQVLFNVSFYFAQIIIALVVDMGQVGIYTFALYMSSLLQAIQRSTVAASISPLSTAWKNKDMGRISRIYARSCINQLIFSAGMFILIWINFDDGILTFHLQPDYLQARNIFLFIGLTKIIDMGTGVNSQIIGTSTFWRFDFITGIGLICLTLPANYFLALHLGTIGPAIADLVTFTVYNAARYIFLYRKFGMQPFTLKTLYTLLLAFAGYLACFYLFHTRHGLGWMVLRSAVFGIIYGGGVLLLRLSDDILPVLRTIQKRLGMVRS